MAIGRAAVRQQCAPGIGQALTLAEARLSG
jgi:hypothetical protein